MLDFKIDYSQIPSSDVKNLCRTLTAAVKAFYDDPKNCERFEEWQRSRKETSNAKKKDDKQPTYNPQFTVGDTCHTRGGAGNATQKQGRNGCYGEFKSTPVVVTNEKYPLSIIDIPKEHPQSYHPTQKPVALLEYLIRTYSVISGKLLYTNIYDW